MPKRVILHAGSHKTGTTALQHALSANVDQLVSAGIVYPDADHRFGHHLLPEAIKRGNRSALQNLCSKTQAAECVLLSSELIECLTVGQLDSLRRLFPGAQFEVVFVMRRLQDVWPSHWRELIKHGLPNPFAHYLGQMNAVAPVAMSTPLRPSQFLERTATVFGRDALKLLTYEAHPRGPDFGPSFINRALGLNDVHPYATETANVTPAYWQIELSRIFNVLGIGWVNHHGRKAISNGLIGKLKFVEPKWTEEFRARLAATDPIVLETDTPIVKEERDRVLDRFGDLFIDPVDRLSAPSRIEVRCLDWSAVPSDLGLEMKKEYRSLRLRLTNVRTPEERAEALQKSLPLDTDA